uniref:Uncharacterized protein n=2 Tax=Percolomonas cosmopolitus TaxID=63605 RepID=A0A7S1KMN3_9EUKA|mmetsp:Transcript_17/g.80  ORF Transcript_17/g.80 Transcript_17/m.80 type:complete len:103 (+) Transcript_17:19-327(+)
MSMVPVILVPVSHYVVHGTRFRWINVQNFRIRALILAASLAVANLVPNQGSVGGPVSLIGQLTAFRLSPFGAITNYVAIKYLDVETSGTKFFFVEGSDKVVV